MYKPTRSSYSKPPTFRGGYSNITPRKINQIVAPTVNGKMVGGCCDSCSYGKDMCESDMSGSGFMDIMAGLDRLSKSYGKSMETLGVSKGVQAQANKVGSQVETKILQTLKDKGASQKQLDLAKAGSTAVGKELTKKLQGKGMHGNGFWDSLLSVVSWLPIPIVSDVCRAYKFAQTAIKTAKGEPINKALGGIVTSMTDVLAKVPVVGAIAAPVGELAKMTGFGLDDVKTGDAKSEDVEKSAEIVKESGDHIKNVLNLVPIDPLMPPEVKKTINDLKNTADQMSKVGSEIQAGSGLKRSGDGILGDIVNTVLPRKMRTKKSDSVIIGDVANAIIPPRIRKGRGKMADEIKKIVGKKPETLTQYINRRKNERESTGMGIKRAGEGLNRAGQGLNRAGQGMKRAGDGVGAKLKEEMIAKYGITKH